jgi:hypothetical protein
MKVKKKRDPSIFLTTCWNLSQMCSEFKKNLQNLAKLAHFILCIGRNHIFQVEIWRKFASNETLVRP